MYSDISVEPDCADDSDGTETAAIVASPSLCCSRKYCATVELVPRRGALEGASAGSRSLPFLRLREPLPSELFACRSIGTAASVGGVVVATADLRSIVF